MTDRKTSVSGAPADTWNTSNEMISSWQAFQIWEEKWFILCYDPVEYFHFIPTVWASLVAQMVKNLPAMQETQVQYLGQEDALEKETATHSSILAWRMGYCPWGCIESDTTKQLIDFIRSIVQFLHSKPLLIIFQMWAITWLSVILWEIDFHQFETFREK